MGVAVVLEVEGDHEALAGLHDGRLAVHGDEPRGLGHLGDGNRIQRGERASGGFW